MTHMRTKDLKMRIHRTIRAELGRKAASRTPNNDTTTATRFIPIRPSYGKCYKSDRVGMNP
ncbi:hypothetical protein GCM10007079_16190 [Nocardiopsis terrae]|nr:hypothetical protein GCM10007079_16190 [Nocardiopsis terrae]